MIHIFSNSANFSADAEASIELRLTLYRDFETEIQTGQQLDELIGVGKSVRHNGPDGRAPRCALLAFP